MSVAEDNETRAQRLFDDYEHLKRSGDIKGAITSLEKSADLGAIYAIYSLAYEYSNSVPPENTKAIRLYEKAVSMGDALSAWNLARHYEIALDSKLYFYWLDCALKMGMPEAGEEMENPFPYLKERISDLVDNGQEAEAQKYMEFIDQAENS